tara:strand:- start:585 stop:773 length:189 start_codon:yes stop_codon:yes gene_type:complete
MNITLQDARILIDVINKELDITRLKIESTNDALEKSHLLNLQSLRNDFENYFFDQVIDKEEV